MVERVGSRELEVEDRVLKFWRHRDTLCLLLRGCDERERERWYNRRRWSDIRSLRKGGGVEGVWEVRKRGVLRRRSKRATCYKA